MEVISSNKTKTAEGNGPGVSPRPNFPFINLLEIFIMNKQYQVKCKEDLGGTYLSVTHNGYQWTSIHIREPDDEIPKIIEVLKKYLTRQHAAFRRR